MKREASNDRQLFLTSSPEPRQRSGLAMKALILAPFHPAALQHLEPKVEVLYESWLETRRLYSPEELGQRLREEKCSILVVEADFVFEEVFEQAHELRFVGVCRGSAKNVDLEAATRHGVLVVNTLARNAVAVAELTLGLMLALARNIPAAHELVKSGRWQDPVSPYFSLRGVELHGKVAGIVGLGAVGKEVARRLLALGMRVLAFDPFVGAEEMAGLGVEKVELDRLLREADFVTLHCPVSPETIGLLDERGLRLMKSTAYLVNTAGWEVVEEEPLLQTLKERRIAGAAFDVFPTHPVPPQFSLLELDNVVLTPHIGGASDGTVERQSWMMVEEIERFLRGERPLNPLNPQVLGD